MRWNINSMGILWPLRAKRGRLVNGSEPHNDAVAKSECQSQLAPIIVRTGSLAIKVPSQMPLMSWTSSCSVS
jgi:hypothetical protein